MAIGSIPAKGSSSRMNAGSVARARAISTRRRSPPDSSAPCDPRDDGWKGPRAPTRCAPPRRRGARRGPRARRTRSRAPSAGGTRWLPGGGSRAPRRARRYMGSRVTSSPPRRIVPFVGSNQSDDHVEGRRLAGPVGPEEPDDLAPRDVDVHAADDRLPAVALHEVAGLESVRGAHGSPRPAGVPGNRTARAPSTTLRFSARCRVMRSPSTTSRSRHTFGFPVSTTTPVAAS